MGSVGDTPVMGQYMHPVIDQTSENDDPWQRNYFQPPVLEQLVPRSYPLIDIRPLLSRPEYSPTALLKSHGFGVVQHHSALLAQLDGDVARQAVTEVYHPEIRELVLNTTGAKSVFIMASILRQGKRAPEPYKLPTGLKSASLTADASRSKQAGEEESNKPVEEVQPHKLAGQSKLNLAAPVRVPHLDFTPLGARQTIRSLRQDIYDAATQSGVIDKEDRICESHSLRAFTKEANRPIAEEYNHNDRAGPRYAAYSIWRPLKTVEHDPLTLAPRKESESIGGEMIYWPYQNKKPGVPELGGDYLQEYAMLGVQWEEAAASDSTESDPLEWYYVSRQQPDEVLFIKLFDSASLGSNSQHAGAPWHASPEIGAIAGDQPRESIDIRVLVFW